MTASPYNEAFFDRLDVGSVSSADVVIPLLLELLSFSSVVDLGCGRGGWLKACLDHGATTVCGFDGDYVDRSRLLIPHTAFHPIDLRNLSSISGAYDLAICLEVAEHLPRRLAGPLVLKLCQLAPVVMFSAAIPGQGGTNHVNEQWPHYWQALFERRGFVQLDPFRLRIAGDDRVATHYKQNLFLYARRSQVDCSVVLTRELARTITQDVTVIATSRLPPFFSVSGMWAEFWRTVARSVRNRLEI